MFSLFCSTAKTANICLRSLASSAAPSTSPDPKKAVEGMKKNGILSNCCGHW
jgi:hypothetical protein